MKWVNEHEALVEAGDIELIRVAACSVEKKDKENGEDPENDVHYTELNDVLYKHYSFFRDSEMYRAVLIRFTMTREQFIKYVTDELGNTTKLLIETVENSKKTKGKRPVGMDIQEWAGEEAMALEEQLVDILTYINKNKED